MNYSPPPTDEKLLLLVCRGCGARGADGRIGLHADRYPRCWGCGAWLVYYGKTPGGPCISGSGRTDGHMTYARAVRRRGELIFVCAFCGKP